MSVPIRLQRKRVPAALRKIVPTSADPRIVLDGNCTAAAFGEAMDVFRVGGTFKTTAAQRYPRTVRALEELQLSEAVILDVGASDGSAALGCIGSLSFRRYYIADKYLNVKADRSHTGMLFLDCDDRPLIVANEWIVVRLGLRAPLWPLSVLADRIVERAVARRRHAPETVLLISPTVRELRSDAIRILQYDVFTPWPHERADLVIAANLFNRVYFTDRQISIGLSNVAAAMNEGAHLAIVENRQSEQASIFRRSGGRLGVQRRIGPGSDIESIATELRI